MNSLSRFYLAVAGCLIGFSATGATQAQGATDAAATAAPEEEGGAPRSTLSRIVVTAGAEKVAIETPQAVTTLDQEDIDAKQATTIADLLEDVPGVSAVGGASALGQSFNIRGIGAALAGDESKIIVQVDGVGKFHEQYRVGSFFSEPELYKRVDVLRGPASSTLYGTGALAGVITFATKDARDILAADKRFAVRVKGGYEDNSESTLYSGLLALQPLERLDVLAAYNQRGGNDYENGSGEVVLPSRSKSESFLVKSRLYLGEGTGHSFWASYQNWLSDSFQLYDQQVGASAAFVRRKVDDTTAVFGYDNRFEGNDWLDLAMQVSYADTFVDQSDNEFSPTALGLASEYSYATTQARVQNTSTFSLNEATQLFLTAGAQASRQQRRNPRTLANGTVVYGAGTHPEGDTQMSGLFVQSELVWDEKLTLIAGVRFDDQHLDPGEGVPTATEVDNNAFSPKLAALYNFTPHFGVFGSFARTERLPTLDETFSRSGTRGANFTLEPEESDNTELGVTLNFAGLAAGHDSLALKLTGFQNDVTNLITPAAAGSWYSINVGEGQYRGVELEAEYTQKQFYVRAAASTMEGTDETTDLPLNTIPADELSVTAAYMVRSAGLTFGWRGEFARAQNEVSGAFATPTPGYGVHSLFGTWRPQRGALRGMDVRLGVDNLMDKTFRRHLASLDAEGRSFKLTVGHTFQ
jgi:hemoglobin/transferrin/lactoferrin receptor protein